MGADDNELARRLRHEGVRLGDFGQIKIWGEVVEHEVGYRSQFGRIVSLDYGDRELLEKFRKIYRVNQVLRGNHRLEDGGRVIWCHRSRRPKWVVELETKSLMAVR